MECACEASAVSQFFSQPIVRLPERGVTVPDLSCVAALRGVVGVHCNVSPHYSSHLAKLLEKSVFRVSTLGSFHVLGRGTPTAPIAPSTDPRRVAIMPAESSNAAAVHSEAGPAAAGEADTTSASLAPVSVVDSTGGSPSPSAGDEKTDAADEVEVTTVVRREVVLEMELDLEDHSKNIFSIRGGSMKPSHDQYPPPSARGR